MEWFVVKTNFGVYSVACLKPSGEVSGFHGDWASLRNLRAAEENPKVWNDACVFVIPIDLVLGEEICLKLRYGLKKG